MASSASQPQLHSLDEESIDKQQNTDSDISSLISKDSSSPQLRKLVYLQTSTPLKDLESDLLLSTDKTESHLTNSIVLETNPPIDKMCGEVSNAIDTKDSSSDSDTDSGMCIFHKTALFNSYCDEQRAKSKQLLLDNLHQPCQFGLSQVPHDSFSDTDSVISDC